jgi:hypothetical protein
MTWIKLGILLSGFLYAGLLPYTLRRAVQHVDIDLEKYTLSFLSNRELYGDRYRKAYKRLLFAVAILNFAFFWLLSRFYDLGEHARFMRYIDYSFAFLTLLAFVPHNIHPYSFQHLGKAIQRALHNLLAILVFLMLPTLVLLFHSAIMPEMPFLGVSGLIIISLVVLTTLWSIFLHGLNGIAELIFINGISIWSIYVTILTFIR